MDALSWRMQLLESIRIQLGAGDSPADDLLLTQIAEAMEGYLVSAIGDGCATLLDYDARLLTVAALRAQLLYDPLGVPPQQEAAISVIIDDLCQQLRCEYRRKEAAS